MVALARGGVSYERGTPVHQKVLGDPSLRGAVPSRPTGLLNASQPKGADFLRRLGPNFTRPLQKRIHGGHVRFDPPRTPFLSRSIGLYHSLLPVLLASTPLPPSPSRWGTNFYFSVHVGAYIML